MRGVDDDHSIGTADSFLSLVKEEVADQFVNKIVELTDTPQHRE